MEDIGSSVRGKERNRDRKRKRKKSINGYMIDSRITRKTCERSTVVSVKGGKILTEYKLGGMLLDTRVHAIALVVGGRACTEKEPGMPRKRS